MTIQLVRDVMTDRVVAVREHTPYKEIVEVFVNLGVSATPVVDQDTHVVGMVSEADVLHKLEFTGDDLSTRLFERHRRRAAKAKAAGDSAGELMSAPVITTRPTATLAEAARLMEAAQVKRLPVIDEQGRLVGIVARRDLLRPYLRPDPEIRSDVVDQVVRRAPTIGPSDIYVFVADGVITLTGSTQRRSTAQMAVSLTRAIAGVVDVVDKLTWERDDLEHHSRPFDYDSEYIVA